MTTYTPEQFNSVVRDGISAAAARCAPDQVLNTRDLFLAVMLADAAGEWDRIALDFASEEALSRSRFRDPDPERAGAWDRAAVSATAVAGLAIAVRLAHQYGAEYVTAGLTALGMVADPRSAASMALTGGDPARHSALVEALQDGVVGVSLGGLVEALRESLGAASPAGEDGFDTVVARLGGSARLGERTELDLLGVCLESLDDTDLEGSYQRMLLDTETVREVAPLVADLPGESAAAVVERAAERFDNARPDARQLIVAATMRPGPRVARAMWLLGLPERLVGFEAAWADARAHRVGDEVSDSTGVLTKLNALLSTFTSLLIVRAAVDHDNWWPDIVIVLVLIYLTWTGSRVGNLVLIAACWFWAGSGAAAVALAMSLVGIVFTRSEQINALHRTGYALSMVQWRRHLRLRYARQSPPLTRKIRWRREHRLAAARA